MFQILTGRFAACDSNAPEPCMQVSNPHRKVRGGIFIGTLMFQSIVSNPHRKVRGPSRGCHRQASVFETIAKPHRAVSRETGKSLLREDSPFFTIPTIGPRFAIFRQNPSGLVKWVSCESLRPNGLTHIISSDDLPENRRFGRKSVREGQTTPRETSKS